MSRQKRRKNYRFWCMWTVEEGSTWITCVNGRGSGVITLLIRREMEWHELTALRVAIPKCKYRRHVIQHLSMLLSREGADGGRLYGARYVSDCDGRRLATQRPDLA